MSQVDLSGTKLVFSVTNISPVTYSIYPRLRINIKISKFNTGQKEIVTLTNIFGEMYIVTKENRDYYLENMISDLPFIAPCEAGDYEIPFYSGFDYFGISQIEKLRENTDLNLKFIIRFVYKAEQIPHQEYKVPVEYKISKSMWVEKFLKELHFKEVFLLEIPKIGNGEFVEVIQYLDESWRKLALGEYPDVLVSCQKVLEKLKGIVKSKGFANNNEIDFSKIFADSQTVSEAIDSIWRKLFSFFQPGGRHSGRNINKEDAEFALITTWSLINLIVKNIR